MIERTHSGWSIRARLVIRVIAVSTPFLVLYSYSGKMVLDHAINHTQFSNQRLALLLSLNIEQSIIRRHDGMVWAQAQIGAGATFYFTLDA